MDKYYERDETGKMVEVDGLSPQMQEKLGQVCNVKHPPHYTQGEIETIDYIRDKLTKEEFVGYCNANVLKYVSRWRHKGGVEDLRKAECYLQWAIEREVMP